MNEIEDYIYHFIELIDSENYSYVISDNLILHVFKIQKYDSVFNPIDINRDQIDYMISPIKNIAIYEITENSNEYILNIQKNSLIQ